jgi:hypothetical protein
MSGAQAQCPLLWRASMVQVSLSTAGGCCVNVGVPDNCCQQAPPWSFEVCSSRDEWSCETWTEHEHAAMVGWCIRGIGQCLGNVGSTRTPCREACTQRKQREDCARQGQGYHNLKKRSDGIGASKQCIGYCHSQQATRNGLMIRNCSFLGGSSPTVMCPTRYLHAQDTETSLMHCASSI